MRIAVDHARSGERGHAEQRSLGKFGAARNGYQRGMRSEPPAFPNTQAGDPAAGPVSVGSRIERHYLDKVRHTAPCKEATAMGHNQPPDTPDREQHYQPGQNGMYELEFPAPQLSSSDGRGPVLVHALEGFSDAGHAIRLAAGHLKDMLDTELVASFAIDELLDYRSRRPLMTFKTDRFTHYDDPQLSLYAMHDSVGTPFLLLAGMEPDLMWERFITAVRLLAERLGVRQTIGLGTIPMAVPHTRPVTMTAHSNNRELIADFTPWIAEVQVPSSASNLLEYRMAQHGHEVVGFTVHVPHYLAQTDYPAAAQALLEQVAKTGSLQLPLKALEEAAVDIQAKVDEQVEASSEVAQVVAALERQYDAFIAAQENRSLLTRDEDLPSGDELGAEFERFLAQQAEKKFDDDDPT
jgi:PAC2 family